MAIFGISETPEDAELFNTTAAFGGETEPDNANSPTVIPTDYAPPSEPAEVDPELGGGEGQTTSEIGKPAETAPVDLLDTVPSKDKTDMADLD